MRKQELSNELTARAFDFFYWFSRFEFTLKENGYLEDHAPGARAAPGWNEFVQTWQNKYTPSNEGIQLLEVRLRQQIVGEHGQLEWKAANLPGTHSQLAQVVRLLKTVRNNLFHGGKHGSDGWDDPKRTEYLLTSAKAILDDLAALASLEADYTRHY